MLYRSIPLATELHADLSERDALRLRRSRRRLYRELGVAVDLWRALFGAPSASDVFRGGMPSDLRTPAEMVLAETLFVPTTDKLFELFVLFRVVRSLFRDNAGVISAIQPGQNLIAAGAVGDAAVRVYFQGSPPDVSIGNTSQARAEVSNILRPFGVRLGSGIPDIYVEAVVGGARRAVIFECKATKKLDTLIDGIEQCQRYRDNWTSAAPAGSLDRAAVDFQVVTAEWEPGWSMGAAGPIFFEGLKRRDGIETRSRITVTDARVLMSDEWSAWLFRVVSGRQA